MSFAAFLLYTKVIRNSLAVLFTLPSCNMKYLAIKKGNLAELFTLYNSNKTYLS